MVDDKDTNGVQRRRDIPNGYAAVNGKAGPNGLDQAIGKSKPNGHIMEDTNKKDKVSETVKEAAELTFAITLMLVFGGCCTNAWTLEKLLMHDSSIGSALTFLQLSFVAISCLPSFLHRDKSSFLRIRFQLPVAPIMTWSLQVVVLLGVNVFNNWTFVYKIPLTLQIVFRSSGLAVSMLFGYLFLDKRYTSQQIAAVALVTTGVILATLSRPTTPSVSSEHYDSITYLKGVSVMALSLLLSGVLGMLQEKTYRQYGPVWKEGLFYTHALALPLFVVTASDIEAGLESLRQYGKASTGSTFPIPIVYVVVLVNVLTQAACVSGVNRLASTKSSVQTNLLLTARKALSLIVSILWFGSGWSWMLVSGGLLVSIGTALYDWRRGSGGVRKQKTL